VIGISPDNVDSLLPWAEQIGVSFPLAADFFPHGHVALLYGLLRPEGIPDRAMVLVDKDGKVRFIEIYPVDKIPPVDRVMQALREL
jgi:peroxiredoxin